MSIDRPHQRTSRTRIGRKVAVRQARVPRPAAESRAPRRVPPPTPQAPPPITRVPAPVTRVPTSITRVPPSITRDRGSLTRDAPPDTRDASPVTRDAPLSTCDARSGVRVRIPLPRVDRRRVPTCRIDEAAPVAEGHGRRLQARTSRATKRATLVVPSWTRRVASHYAVPRRRASRGALRVGTRSPRTEVCRGGTGFSSTCSLADQTSAPTFYAVSPVTSSARTGAPVQRLDRVTRAPCATDNSRLGQAKCRPYGRVGGPPAASGTDGDG